MFQQQDKTYHYTTTCCLHGTYVPTVGNNGVLNRHTRPIIVVVVGMADSSDDFNASRAIVMSEVHTRDKEKYYDLLLANNARFFKDGDNYVASVRLLAPGIQKQELEVDKTDAKYVAKSLQLPYEERLETMNNSRFVSVNVSGTEQFDYSPYPRFVTLIADNGDTVKPKSRILSWVMKIIEDIYDTRWNACHSKSKNSGDAIDGGVDNDESKSASEIHMNSFPVFVVRRISLTMGLKKVVDQNCWDLLLNLDKYRGDYLEVELFARFMQEFYDHDVLLFFLYVRSMVANVLHVNFKARWTRPDQSNPKKNLQSLWMSFRECITVAKIIFGEDNEQMTRDFLALLQPHLVGAKTEQSDSRRIDITQFLHLAVVGYHQSHPSDSDNSATPTSVFNSGTPNADTSTKGLSSSIAATEGDHIIEQFTNIQQDRENEFLDFICHTLDEQLSKGKIRQESAERILNKLLYQLRVKINAAIGSIEAFNSDVDAFDEALVAILRSDSLRVEMENMRDTLIQTEMS
jgi:hypothetical protein